MEHLTREKAEQLYAVHRERDFFDNLVNFITSGPVMLQVLAGDNAITRYRELMGSTDYQKAKPYTLRADFASSLTENAVHGSDSPESAAYEISLFFKENEIYETYPQQI
jgi:nucleoside-diphosphate kinase